MIFHHEEGSLVPPLTSGRTIPLVYFVLITIKLLEKDKEGSQKQLQAVISSYSISSTRGSLKRREVYISILNELTMKYFCTHLLPSSSKTILNIFSLINCVPSLPEPGVCASLRCIGPFSCDTNNFLLNCWLFSLCKPAVYKSSAIARSCFLHFRSQAAENCLKITSFCNKALLWQKDCHLVFIVALENILHTLFSHQEIFF